MGQVIEKCANCDVTIGRLETPYVWGDSVVCAACYQRLAARGGAQVSEPAAPPEPVPVVTLDSSGRQAKPKPEPPLPLASGWIICPNPNCGYTGPPTKQAKGSGAVLILLLLLWVLPGLLYAIFYSGDTLNCPRCGMKIRDA